LMSVRLPIENTAPPLLPATPPVKISPSRARSPVASKIRTLSSSRSPGAASEAKMSVTSVMPTVKSLSATSPVMRTSATPSLSMSPSMVTLNPASPTLRVLVRRTVPAVSKVITSSSPLPLAVVIAV
jgi:hypothetical protein